MLSKTEFTYKIGLLQEEIKGIAGVDDPETITETATRLKRLNYAPPVFAPVDTFLHFTRNDLWAEVEKITELPDNEVLVSGSAADKGVLEVKLRHASVLVFYFKELAELRRGKPEAWDEIDELYVHD